MVDGSRTIRVLKRDRTAEEFDEPKLAGAMWRAMGSSDKGRYLDAADLAAAIGIYLRRNRCECISSAAVFEMTVRVLRKVGMEIVARSFEDARFERERRRTLVSIAHEGGQVTRWDKSWLARLGGQSWKLQRSSARIMAGIVESQVLAGEARLVTRGDLVERFSELVAQFGLADAVPVEQ